VNTAVILAGGFSERFGQDKGLVRLMGKPLVLHVFDRAREIVEEVAVVVSSQHQREAYLPLFPKKTGIFADIKDSQSPLVGALTGFANSEGDYSILLPCDTPFISGKVMKLLFETSQGIVVLLGCAHAGVINTVNHVAKLTGKKRLYAVLGGMHLIRASDECLEKTANTLAKYDVQMFGPCHCSGDRAKILFRSRFPERMIDCATGRRLTLAI